MCKSILLIGFYNEKALGVRYLANALRKEGYTPHVLFLKRFNSIKPEKVSNKELELLVDLINKINPSYIGLSVMSSLYLESIYLVSNKIREKFDIPTFWGGVYSTLFPIKALDYCDYVIRGEGEETLIELVNTLEKKGDISNIENIVFRDKDNNVVQNNIRPLIQNLDTLGYPEIGGENKYLIHDDNITEGDPQLNSFTYELSASRGCPFACSYCSSINLKRLYNGKGRYVRFRSVDSVIAELKEAKKKIKNLKLIHFWDEIFSDEPGWIEKFNHEYKKEINLPFNIWGHPLKINENIIKNLVDAGLNQIVVGIQSGSPRIRKQVFNRPETQEDIINSSKVLSKCKVPNVIYDFMLQHPFEVLDDLKETFELCMAMEPPFQLQIHGRNFLPGTDIVDMAIDDGHLTNEELEKIMYSSIQEQYDMYWGPAAANNINENDIWISLIYLTQFPSLKPTIRRLKNDIEMGKKLKTTIALQKIMKQTSRDKSLARKLKLVVSK